MNTGRQLVEKITVSPQVIDVYKLVFPEIFLDQENSSIELMNGIAGNDSEWFGIYDKGSVVAFCTIARIQSYVILYNVGVLYEYRNKGYGSELIRYIIDNNDFDNISLFVKKSNHRAIKLYRKYNFEYTDEIFQPPFGYICMVRIA